MVEITKEDFGKALEILGYEKSNVNENIYKDINPRSDFPSYIILNPYLGVYTPKDLSYRYVSNDNFRYMETELSEEIDTLFKPSLDLVLDEQSSSDS